MVQKQTVAVCCTQYVAAMTPCTSDRNITVTYIVHKVVSLHHKMVVEATRNNPCDFTIPRSHFTQQYTVCAVAGSMSYVQSMTGKSRLHIAL
jgi:hypothetical protein